MGESDLLDQGAVLGDPTIDEMQRPSPETGPTQAWERQGSGYGIGGSSGLTDDGLPPVQDSGCTWV